MLRKKIIKYRSVFFKILLISYAVSACQSLGGNGVETTRYFPGDNNSLVHASDDAAADQTPDNPLPQIKKVIEWNTSFSSLIMPPAEVREAIDINCRKIGYDRGVITSMSLSNSKVVADFDCRGEDAT